MYVYVYIYIHVCVYVAVWIHIYTICMGMNIHLPTILIWMNRRGAQCNLKKPLVPGSTSTSSFVSMFHIRPLCSLWFLGVGSLGTTFCKGVSLCSGFNLCRECRGVSHWTFFLNPSLCARGWPMRRSSWSIPIHTWSHCIGSPLSATYPNVSWGSSPYLVHMFMSENIDFKLRQW